MHICMRTDGRGANRLHKRAALLCGTVRTGEGRGEVVKKPGVGELETE